MGMKKCSRCQTLKQFGEFYKDKSKKDGLNWYCKLCSAAKRIQRMLDIIDFQNHPRETKTWIKDLLGAGNRKITYSRRLITNLYKKLIEQPTCLYTNDKLIPGVNCHLDHRIPLSRGGQRLNINNLQWVSRRYNMAKHDMTDEEFKDFCKLILKRWAFR